MKTLNSRLTYAGHGVQDGQNSDTADDFSALPPSATVVFSDITDSNDFGYSVFGQELGQSFTTTNTAETVSDVQVVLDDATLNDGGAVTVTLWTDGGGAGPLTEIATLGTIDDSALLPNDEFTTVDVPVSGAPVLDANTRYWVELSTNSGSNAFWDGTFSQSGTETSSEFSDQGGNIGSDASQGAFLMSVTQSTCFAAGTHIMTVAGERPVETLRPGDRVVALRQGGLASIRWLGHRDVDLRRHPARRQLDPVRVAAEAFAPGVPHRDLLVSPDHAFLLEGKFVTARYLINGASIRQEAPDRITYYHIELAEHDVLLAEGVAAESYLDVGRRAAFANGDGPVMVRPDFARVAWREKSCAPSMDETGRAGWHQRLLSRAFDLGHVMTQEAGLHLLMNGTAIWPEIMPGGVEFALGSPAGRVTIVSRVAVPSDAEGAAADGRSLGVGVRSLALDGVTIALDDGRLSSGWHRPEPGLRWTDGAAWLHVGDARKLTLRLHRGLRYWQAAEAAMHRFAA